MCLYVKVNDLDKIKYFDVVLAEALGGADVVKMLTDLGDGYTVREVADRQGEPRSTVHRKVIRARMALRRLGLMPMAWEGQREAEYVAAQPGAT